MDIESSGKQRPNARKGDLKFLLILLGASLALNVFLWYNSQSPVNTAIDSPLALIAPGAQAQPFVGIDIDGQQKIIAYSDVDIPTVLYVFTPDCKWCERNLANLRMLVSSKKQEYRFIGISLDQLGLKGYVKRAKIDFPVYANLESATISALRLGATPETLVISPKGRVLKSWMGAYVGVVQSEMEQYFMVRLPGLLNPSGDL